MKATLTFNLDDPDDRVAHLRAVKSLDLASALWTLHHNTARRLLDGYETVTPEMYDVHERWIETIKDILDQHGINIDELIV